MKDSRPIAKISELFIDKHNMEATGILDNPDDASQADIIHFFKRKGYAAYDIILFEDNFITTFKCKIL